jgi:hypothetical protein
LAGSWQLAQRVLKIVSPDPAAAGGDGDGDSAAAASANAKPNAARPRRAGVARALREGLIG